MLVTCRRGARLVQLDRLQRHLNHVVHLLEDESRAKDEGDVTDDR